MKFIKIVSLVLILMMTAGCKSNTPEETIYQKINKKYMDIGDYTAKGAVKIYGNKTANVYNFEQYKKSPDKFMVNYTDDGVSIMFDKSVAKVYNQKAGGEVSFENNADEYFFMFVDAFFKNYYTGELATVQTSAGGTMVLECDMPDSDIYMCKQKLWINTKTILPERMELYDSGGNLVAEVSFFEFEFVKELDDAQFLPSAKV